MKTGLGFLAGLRGIFSDIAAESMRLMRKQNPVPGNIRCTVAPGNDKVELVPIVRGKVESRRAVQWANVTSRRAKGEGFGL